MSVKVSGKSVCQSVWQSVCQNVSHSICVNVEPGCHVLCQPVVQAEHLVAYRAGVTLIGTY